ncbi:MAG: sigma-70 family RNA polymerase sigma factor [Oscillospiraceae bacterium]|nr:sigma-70 family RNA polymerase sigma factor [Oscillospiraceae bacterium]
MVSDDSIIKRLNNRDESALQDIQKLYGSICYQMAYRLLESHEDAEECVNDMLMSVWDSIPPHLPMSLQAYLLTLVRRSAIDKLKHENRKKRGSAECMLALDELAEIIPSGEQLESIVEHHELLNALRAFLHTLKPQTRYIVMQRYIMSESIPTIAATNHMSEEAVKKTLFRTRSRLRDYLRKEGLL